MVLLGRIELPTSPLPRVRSTTELQQQLRRDVDLLPHLRKPKLDRPYGLGYALRMNTPPDNKPKKSKAKDADRADRLKAALKANMAKRKAQARARKAETTGQSKDT